ncbi:MAG: acyl-CoA dehydrogenase C-terminal domain-containing protein [Acetobacteraceae bacterium]|nr:acyl-CoA dehydrogenase C-terminal domain-containing protein [Acetobacteraceae bacterium]MBV8521741.1 acyl-CoA dehydrogenase C-terminal domain-containing protein [Acetobacteraceae bacterium]
MTTYLAPVRDMKFVINDLADLQSLVSLPGYEEVTPDLAGAVLEEGAKLACEVLGPLNKLGDQRGATWTQDGVRAAEGFGAAYRQFMENGWNALSGDPEYGGQGLPGLVSAAAVEMWNSANMSFALCPLLSAGATEAIKAHASDELKARYLPQLISGEWTGTMNLTEPNAGSDLSAVRTRAVPDGAHYRIFGQKIFITWGDHDMTDNVVHLVLARLPDAPEGTRGISLFLVPKFLVNADGSLGQRNDVHCTSIEHKLGIHASPTCVMTFGDKGGAIGYLVGEENHGLAHMFTMMNEARQKVGIQGLAIAERAYQAARDYAKERVQGRPAGSKTGDRVTIIHHPDVRRMLLTMKAQVEAMRAFGYSLAADIDVAHRHPDEAERRRREARVDLLTPVLKGWCTELGVEIASLGVQVYGGMGYIEETGACQYLRDSRISPIYEGTTGIQAADLVGRKLTMDKGQPMIALIAEMRNVESQLDAGDNADFPAIRAQLASGIQALEQASEWVLRTIGKDPDAALAASVNYMMLAGYVCGGWQMARAALAARTKLRAGEDEEFCRAKIATARFYAEQILPKASALLTIVKSGASTAFALGEEQF